MIRNRETIAATLDKLGDVWLRNPHLSLLQLAEEMVRQACISCRHCSVGMISEGASHLIHDDTDLINLIDVDLMLENRP